MSSSIQRFLKETEAQGTSTSPVTSFLNGTQEVPPLDVALRAAEQTDPAKAARILTQKRATGLPSPLIADQLDTLEQASQRSAIDSARLERESPRLAGWLAEDPQHVAVAKAELPRLSYLERQILSISEAFTSGKAMRSLAEIAEKVMLGRDVSPEERAKIKPLRQQMASAQTYGIGERTAGTFNPLERIGVAAGNFLESVPTFVANQLPLQPATAAGGVAGALIGGGAGTMVGGPVAGAAAAGIGWRAGASVQAGRMEAALAYLDYDEMRTDDGQPLSRTTKLAAAGVVGAVNGALEGFFGTEAGKAIPGLRSLGREAVKKALAKQTTRQAFERFGTAVAQNSAEEGVTEFAQEIVTAWSGEIAKMVESKEPLTVAHVLERLANPDTFKAALESARAGAGGGGGMAAVTAGASLYGDVQKARQAEKFAAVLTEVSEGVKESTLAKDLPAVHRDLIARMTKDGPLETVYADVEFFQSHFQASALAPEEVADELGIRDAYEEAVRTGGELAIPFATFVSTIAPSEHASAFVKELRVNPGEMNARQALEWMKEQDKRDAETQADPVAASAATVGTQVADQLESSGFDRTTAESYAKVYEAAFRTLGQRSGQDPAALFAKYGLTIQRQDGPAALAPAPMPEVVAAAPAPAPAEPARVYATPKEAGKKQDYTNLAPADLVDLLAAEQAVLDGESVKATRGWSSVDENMGIGRGGGSLSGAQAQKRGKYALDRIDAIEAQLREAGLTDDEIMSVRMDPEAAAEKSAMLRGDLTLAQSEVITDDAGNELFQPAVAPAIGSPAFDAWFGNSKVVDENGDPLVVYHGTTGDFDTFATGRNKAADEVGIFFTPDPAIATAYAGYDENFPAPELGSVMPVYLRLVNPKIVDFQGERTGRGKALADAVAEGHDGAIFLNHYDAGGVQTQYVVFEPTQIKSAIGNRGTYDPSNPNILFQPPVTLSPDEEAALLREMLESGFASQQGNATVQVPQGQRIDGAENTTDVMKAAMEKVGRAEFRRLADAEIAKRAASGDVDAQKAAIEQTARSIVGRVYHQSAFHGSPHIFPRFSLDKIGTGEGAQVYGWGLYFAGRKEVAKWYRDKLSRPTAQQVKPATANRAAEGYVEEVLYRMTENNEGRAPSVFELHYEAMSRSPWLTDGDLTRADVEATLATYDDVKVKGRLYKVEIPEDDTYLLWDAPLDQQPDAVKAGMRKLMDMGVPFRRGMTGAEAYHLIQAIRRDDGAYPADKAASDMLNGVGVSGIKYLDGASRGQGEGSYNYVIFDDRLVEIVEYEQGAERGPRGRIRIGEQSIAIDLFKTADLSTFLHETGHFYAEVLRDMALNPNATQQIRDDYAALEKFVGATPGETWTRENHETAARAFEAYLMDGTAPNAELRQVFAKFRAWLVGVYKRMQSLNVQLTPEVRGVFDRLLATDEEITAAETEQRMAPLFDPATSGMSEAQAARYSQNVQRARSAAEEHLAARLMDDLQREQKAWWKAERETMRESVVTELAEEPISRAQVALRSGTMPDGSALPDALAQALMVDGTPRRLDKDAIVARFGKDILKQMKGLYAVEGGINPEEAALLTGFPTGDALIQALVTTEPFGTRVERTTDQRMKEEHGDLLTDGRLPIVAMEAVHSEERAKLLRLELEHLVSADFATFKGLTKRLARRLPPRDAVRAQAERAIAMKPVREINPLLYQRAEARAAKAAIEAGLKGEWEAAFDAKQQELTAHEYYRAAVAARSEVESVVEYMRKFDRPSIRAKMGKAGGDFLEQIDGLRNQYSFRNISLVQLDKNRSLLAFIREQAAQGVSLDIPDDILANADQRNYKEIPLEELRGVRDAVKQIEHAARAQNALLASARAQTMDEARTELVAEAASHFDLTKPPVDLTQPMRQRVKTGLRTGVAAHTKMEFLFRHLDGYTANGPFWTYFFKPMADAENVENTMRRAQAKAMTDIMAAYTKAERRQWFTETVFLPGTATANQTGRYTKANIMAIALNWGNVYNRDALMEGYGWSEPQVMAILGTLDDRDWRTVQAIWDYIDTFWPAAQALEREVTGLSPDKVERAGFTTPSGLYMEGGYYPVAFDREQSSRQTALDLAADVGDMAKGYGAKAMTKHGHLKERTNTGGKPLNLDLSVLGEHLSQVAHDLAFRRAVIDVAKLVRDREIQAAIEGAVGMEMYQQLGPWLSAIAGDRSREPVRWIERMATRARMGVSTVALGFNVISSAMQTLGFSITAKELGPEYTMRGIKGVYGNPAKIKAARDFIFERSAMMRDRVSSFDRDVRDMTRKSSTLGVPGIDPSAFFLFISYMDMGVSLPSWLGAYQKAMDGKQAGIEGGQEQAAIDYADMIVRTTQAAGAAKDLAAVQRGTAVEKLFTAFYSSMAIQFNQFAATGNEFALSKNTPKLVASVALVWFVPALLEDLVRGRGPDEEKEEEWLDWSAKHLVLYPMGTVVGVRDLASAIERTAKTGRPSGGDNAIGTVIQSIATTTIAAFKLADEEAEMTRADAKEAFNTVGYLAQLPTRQVWKTLEFLYESWNGNVETTGPFDFLWKTATGIPAEQR